VLLSLVLLSLVLVAHALTLRRHGRVHVEGVRSVYWIDGVELHLVCITRFISIINFYFTLEESSETESRCISNACAMSRYFRCQ